MYEIWTKRNFNLEKIEETEAIKGIKTYKRGVYEFELDERPKCKICGSDLKFIKIGKRLIIDKCLNENCPTNDNNLKKGAPIKWKAFLPDNVLEQQHRNHSENTCFNKNYLLKKGLQIDEIDDFISKLKQKISVGGHKNKGVNKLQQFIDKYGTELGKIKYNESCSVKIEHWLAKGYSLDEAKNKISEIQSKNSRKVKNRFVLSKQYLDEKGIDSNLFMREKSQLCIEYWLKRGYTIDEARNKIFEIQSKNSHKQTYFSIREKSHRCIEHWIKLGYSEEESKQIIKNYQTTFSKEICIAKHGKEKGLEIFRKRQEKWQLTLHKNHKLHCGYSQISQELFNELYKHTNNEVYYGSLNREYTIYNDENKHVYAFDFTDLTNRKIIEFQGDIYHGNPKLFNENDKPSPWNNLTAKELWKKDDYKKQIAITNNFDVMQIWEYDFRNNKEEVIKKCLNFLNYE